ncbi:MFS transporter [Leisingera thetidis]|uniref:MFS transporter n=1 Tax=Leisingera thetidis TaxID=2930199 RepID=UPI0021F6EF7A|nr:MFS transporter [Leisingera thetidis]
MNRWTALTIISVSFLQCTLNWFGIVPAFGSLMTEMGLGYPELGLLVGIFVAGYGIAHIPAGLISEAFGMRFAMVAGIAVLTLGTVLAAVTSSYQILLVARFISGVGASIYVGAALGLTAAWFRGHELGTAYGIVSGVAFTLGALLGLYVWIDVVAALGWRGALLAAAGVAAATFLLLLIIFPVPTAGEDQQEVGASNLNTGSLKRTFGNHDLWLISASFIGGYGSYLTASQLLPQFASEHLQIEAHDASLLGAVLLVSGIVGGPLGGWLADRVFGMIPTFIAACIVQSAAQFLVPHLGFAGLVVASAVIGTSSIMAFSAWISTPGFCRDWLEISDIPTACGLMLTISAIGGFIVPILYGWMMANAGHQAAWFLLGGLPVATMLICVFAPLRSLKTRQVEATAEY